MTPWTRLLLCEYICLHLLGRHPHEDRKWSFDKIFFPPVGWTTKWSIIKKREVRFPSLIHTFLSICLSLHRIIILFIWFIDRIVPSVVGTDGRKRVSFKPWEMKKVIPKECDFFGPWKKLFPGMSFIAFLFAIQMTVWATHPSIPSANIPCPISLLTQIVLWQKKRGDRRTHISCPKRILSRDWTREEEAMMKWEKRGKRAEHFRRDREGHYSLLFPLEKQDRWAQITR